MKKHATPTGALQEKEGIAPPESINTDGVQKLANHRKIQPSSTQLTTGILAGDKVALSRAITLVESTQPKHLAKANEIIQACLPHANASVRIGITGVPGVGKSTFIEAFGNYLTQQGKKVAVLAVDPSSTISRGSILGDKTRMESLVKNEQAYIRPSASGTTLGGVAGKTRETILLCEAAGYDVILIETVGVGQSETAVHSMVDFFLLLKISGAGDELQGIKRGIMEMADAVIINKADGDNLNKAKLTRTEFNRALHMFPAKNSGWSPVVATCSALQNEGIDAVWQIITDYLNLTQQNGYFTAKRQEQNQYWLVETISNQLNERFYNTPKIKTALETYQKAIAQNEISPFAAAQQLLEQYFKED